MRRAGLRHLVAFETLPVVHYEDGKLHDAPGESVERTLTQLARRFGRVVVVDVQGVKRNEPDLEALQAASRRRAVWWDAGSRYATDVMDLFVAGAESVTIRWNTIHDPQELQDVGELLAPETVHVALEHPRGTFLRHPRDPRGAADVARFVDSLGLNVVHVVDRADLAFLRTLPLGTKGRRILGPVAGMQAELEEIGFDGAIVPADRLPPEEAEPQEKPA